MKNEILSRIEKLKKKMEEKKINAVLLISDENVFYYSGFTGDSTEVLVTNNNTYLFTDFRYTEQAEKETSGCEVLETKAVDRMGEIDSKLKLNSAKKLGIEKKAMTLSYFENCQNTLSAENYFDVSDDIAILRSIKSSFEIKLMAKAAKISDDVFLELLTLIKPGISEVDINAELTYLFNKQGCGLSFTPIIASGENSSLPHAPITDRKLQNGDFLTIDFGCKLGKYCTDCTRTVGIGGLAKEEKKVYDIVKFAQAEAFNAIKPGITCEELDAVARDIISEAGYGKNFGHSLGHGVGLDIHEFPGVGQGMTTVLEPGMVITIEPGIYLKNQFGVRIEDMCFVTENGGKSFNQIDRDLKII
ncbi:MAG: aminopeptidase P family protein [Eubacteriales bacterium]